jgi:hypothetical protein
LFTVKLATGAGRADAMANTGDHGDDELIKSVGDGSTLGNEVRAERAASVSD